MRISDWSSDVCSSDLAVKIVTDPVEDLLKASALVPPVGAERRISEEEHTLGRAYGRAQLPLIEMLDVERETADRGPVATCILQQRLGDRKSTRLNSSH